MKTRKEFAQIPLFIPIIVGILVIGLMGSYFLNNGNKTVDTSGTSGISTNSQQSEIENLKKEVSNLKSTTRNAIRNAENQTTALQSELHKDKINSPTELTAAEITKEWSPQVAYVVCQWNYSDGTIGPTASGSGFLTNYTDGSIAIETNKHIILYQGKYTPAVCTASFLNGEKYTINWSRNFGGWSAKYDKGQINLYGLSDYLKNIVQGHYMVLHPQGFACDNEPEIGDKIVVLGYPGIGSNKGITVTEGIISGYEGDYYVTSAKIDHGNSGGIAVSVKEDCVVGMPSASVGGDLESLGRILSTKAMLAQ